MLSVVINNENKLDENSIVITEKKDINHIVSVYRLNTLDKLRVVDGENEYITEIVKISKKEICLKILSQEKDKYSLDIEIDMAIGIIKNDNMKLVIKKLTEIGVNKIIPLKTERVVVKINDKKDKWDDVVNEAMKQCRAVKSTKIESIKTLRELNLEKYDKIIYMYEASENSRKITDYITELDKKILCIVGPEGGFTQKEVEFMKKNKFLEINLGNRILRAETAGIYVASVIAHVYGI